MNKDISLLRCREENRSRTGGKEYPIWNSLKVNFGDLYSLMPRKTLAWDYKPCSGALASPGRLGIFAHVSMFAAASTQHQNLK